MEMSTSIQDKPRDDDDEIVQQFMCKNGDKINVYG